MRKLREILRLKYERRMSHRAIARACGVGVGTVSEYVRRAKHAGLNWPLPPDLDDRSLEAQLFTVAAPDRDRVPPDVARIHQELKRTGVTLQLLWEEYAEVHPDGYRRSQYCEIYRRWSKKLKPSMRQVHRAGEKTFIDFSGKQPHIVDRKTGEQIEVELFVAVLGASSFTYAEAVESQKLPCWVDVHTRMIDYFGGSTEIWVPDQLKSGVTRSCRYEPKVNRTYQGLAEHYEAVVIPARPRKPKDKAKVESAVLVAQRWILARLRDQTFFSIAELNQAIRKMIEDLNDSTMNRRSSRFRSNATKPRSGRTAGSTSTTTSRSITTTTASRISSEASKWRRVSRTQSWRLSTRASGSRPTVEVTSEVGTRPRPSTCRARTGRIWSGRPHG
jgi:transposase